MSLFRKLGQNLVPAFRKIPQDFGRFGRKISSGAEFVERNLDKATNFLDKVDRAIPNPITKSIRGAIGGVADIAGGVSKGGQALSAVSRGDFNSAASLGKAAFNQSKSGVGQEIGLAGRIAPMLV